MGFIFDNLCVAVGVIILWISRGRSYGLKQELNKAGRGVFSGANWLEGIIGLIVFVIAMLALWILGIIR